MMEKTYSFIDLPAELIFEILSDVDFDVRVVLKLRAINRTHLGVYDIGNIITLYQRCPGREVILRDGKSVQ